VSECVLWNLFVSLSWQSLIAASELCERSNDHVSYGRIPVKDIEGYVTMSL